MPGNAASTDGNATTLHVSAVTALLITVILVSSYLIYSLWSSSSWQPASGPVPSSSCKDKTPVLQNAYPNPLSAGTAYPILLIGCNFPQTTSVKVNGAQHGSAFIDSERIRVQLSATDLASPGPLPIAVSDGKMDFGVGALDVSPPAFQWQVFGGRPFQINQELQLLLLVLLTGCFGSCIYATKSLADYWGDSKLCKSWILFYVVQPLEGAGIALLIYLCIRGGFLAAGGSDIKAVNQFGVCAIAGLSGAFSDIAFSKLREVFQTLFKPQDTRGDKISQKLSITSKALPPGVHGQGYSQTLQASGGTAPLQWSVTPGLPAGLNLNTDTGAITGTPTAAAAATEYTFAVKDSATPSTTATVKITLEIQ